MISNRQQCAICKQEDNRLVSALANGGRMVYVCEDCFEVMKREKEKREKAAAAEPCAKQPAGVPPAAPEKT